jgi:hypothetical protein
VTYRAATPLAELTEAQFQAQVIELAGLLGYKHYFTYRSKRSPAGWPDLALCRDRLVLVELKREAGVVSPKQKDWIRWLLEAHVETYVCRPADLDDLAAVFRRAAVCSAGWRGTRTTAGGADTRRGGRVSDYLTCKCGNDTFGLSRSASTSAEGSLSGASSTSVKRAARPGDSKR